MAVSKVILNGTTLIDVTDDTVAADKLLSGYTATINSGVEVQGSIQTKTSSDITVNTNMVSIPAGYYVVDIDTIVPLGTITNNTTLPSGSSSSGTISRGSYIKIGAGYHPDTYYLAQSNSGTKIVTESDNAGTDISVDGYANVNITGINVPAGEAFTINSEAASYFDNIPVTINGANNRYYLFNNADAGGACFVSITAKGNVTNQPLENGYGNFRMNAYVNPTDSAKTGFKDIVSFGRWVTTNVAASGTYYGRVVIGTGSATTPATTITANPTITVGNDGVITATASATQSVIPTVSAGYVGSGTAGTITVSGSNTQALTTLGATTYNTSLTDQTIISGQYITGTQTIKAVTTSGNITAENIKDGVTVTVGDANNAARIVNVTGSFTDSSTVSQGQTAATATEIRSGYSAWVGGTEVQGSLGNSTMSQGITTVSNDEATRGELTWSAGVTTSGSLEPASFSNSVANGKTADDYVNISSTSEAPVLVSGGYLYINKGYTDDLKISLAKLVPDGASADLAEGHILSGYSAYNNNGVLVAGNIPTKTDSNLSASGDTVTVPAGYYAQQYTKAVAAGAVTNNTTLPSGTSSAGTINRGSYIKIGAGYHQETYYQAQTDDLGVKTITNNQYAHTNIDVTGYSAVKVIGLKIGATDTFSVMADGAQTYDSSKPIIVGVGQNRGIMLADGEGCTDVINITGSATVNCLTNGKGQVSAIAYVNSGDTTRTSSQTIIQNGRWVTTNVADAGTFYGRVVVSAGTITNNTNGGTSSGTINRGNQIKIGAGFYASDTYYAAEANTGTKSITTSNNANSDISVDGYANVNISGLTVPVGSAFTLNLASGLANPPASTTINVGSYRFVSLYDDTGSIIGFGSKGTISYAASENGSGSLLVSAYVNASDTTKDVGTSIVQNGRWVTNNVVTAGTYYGRTIVSAGSITNNTTLPSGSTSSGTINRGSYIKIEPGYYSETAYYMAQTDDSGTKLITSADYANSNISVDGYSHVNISGMSVPEDEDFTLNLADAQGPTATSPTVYVGAVRTVNITDSTTSTVNATGKGSYYLDCDTTNKTLYVYVNAYTDSTKTTKSSSQNIVSNGVWNTTNVSAGGTYYGKVVVASGSATTPATSITATPSISVDTATGLITSTASASQSITPTVSAGYVGTGTAGTVTVSGSNTSQLDTINGTTFSPTESEQTVIAANVYTLGAIKVGAISSTYVGSGITQRDSTDLTANAGTITAPAGYYGSNASFTIPLANIASDSVISNSSTYFLPVSSSATSYDFSVTPRYSSTAGYTPSHTNEAGTEMKYDIKKATPVFDGGDLMVSSSAQGTNVTLSSSTNNGICIQTRGVALRDAVLYNGAVEGWVSKSDNAQALAGSSKNVLGDAYYINGVNIPIPESGTNTFTVTVPNGANDTVTITFTVDSNGNSEITDNTLGAIDATGVLF